MVSSVDLPDPLGPITATISPARTDRDTPASARTGAVPCEYTFDTSRKSSTFVASASLIAWPPPGAVAVPRPVPAQAAAVARRRLA